MTETTPLDAVFAAMQVAPDANADAARLKYYEALADTELFVMLAAEAEGDRIEPELFPVADGTFALGFDTEARLAEFAGRPAPFAALPGRIVAALLAEAEIGLAVNPDVAASTMLLPPAALGWLVQTLGAPAPQAEGRAISQLHAPRAVPQGLLDGLAACLTRAPGLAQTAWLAEAAYGDGTRGHVLALIGAAPEAEAPLARAVAEALTFSGIEAGFLDVGFFAATDPLAARLEGVGLRFDIPKPEQPARPAPQAPGSDPAKPPRLR